jgi:hypothetical protein
LEIHITTVYFPGPVEKRIDRDADLVTVDLQGLATEFTLQFCTAALLIMPGTSIIEVIGRSATEESVLVEGVARVEDTVVTRGKLSFARKIV